MFGLGPFSHLEFELEQTFKFCSVSSVSSTKCEITDRLKIGHVELTHKTDVGVCLVELSSIIRLSSRHEGGKYIKLFALPPVPHSNFFVKEILFLFAFTVSK